MATLTANTPAIPEHCIHKLPTSCRLTARPICCACQDRRPQSGRYRKYIDGIGFVYQGTRQEHYCWNCMVFWDVRIKESEWPNTSCRIPGEPLQDVFLRRWHEFHKWYRTSDGRPPEFDGAEALNTVPIGRLPRTAKELGDGVLLERRVQPRQQRPSDLLAGVSRQDVAEEDRLFDDEDPQDVVRIEQIVQVPVSNLDISEESTNALSDQTIDQARGPNPTPGSEPLRTFQSTILGRRNEGPGDNLHGDALRLRTSFGIDERDIPTNVEDQSPLFRGIERLVQDLKSDLDERSEISETITNSINDVLQFLVYAYFETADSHTISLRGKEGQIMLHEDNASTNETRALTDQQRDERILAELDEKVDSIAALHTLARDTRKQVRDRIRAAWTDARRQRLWGTEEQRASDTYESPLSAMESNARTVFRRVWQRQRDRQQEPTAAPTATSPAVSASATATATAACENREPPLSPGRTHLLSILRQSLTRKLQELVADTDLNPDDLIRGIESTVPAGSASTPMSDAEKLEAKIAYFQEWTNFLPKLDALKDGDDKAATLRYEAYTDAFARFPNLAPQFRASRRVADNVRAMARKVGTEGLIPRVLSAPETAPLTTRDFMNGFSDWFFNGARKLHEANLTREHVPKPLEEHELNVKMRCAACFEQRANVVFIPCGHIAFCKWCCEVVYPSAKHDRTAVREASAKCPLCRKQIRHKYEVFVLEGESDKKEEHVKIEQGESSRAAMAKGEKTPANNVARK